jgi:PD-(D/E)XK nuclease superfamily protein
VDAGDGEGGETYAARRRVDGESLRAAVQAAQRLRERLSTWPQEAAAGDHLRRVRALLGADLGWPAEEELAPVLQALAELEREIPPELPLTREELRTLLGRALEETGKAPLGGRGGGVQVLTVTEARGRTFEHLFLLGLNRDLFPRAIREDPLLPDVLRRILRRVLPDVPVKSGGFDEERYLFSQLLAASPAVTLSWQSADADGRAVSPSPLLRGARADDKAPSLYAGEGPRPADEQAVVAALHGSRQRFAGALATALQEARGELLDSPLDLSAADLGRARVRVLDELDPDLRTPEGRATRGRLGPYFGFIGGAGSPGALTDPRHIDLFVTHLEGMAGCPWQLFLGRLLRLEPTPDPLAALPGADPLLLGNAVHAVLERIVRESAAAPDGAPALVFWPAPERLDRMLEEAAGRLLAAEGIRMPALARALGARARPLVEAARAVDWSPGEPLPVLAVEAQASVVCRDASGESRILHFRADRVDRAGEALRYTDYKTGRPLSPSKSAETRRRHFLESVRAGTHLQAIAYLLAAGDEPAVGRYLYLRPGLREEERELAVTGGDRELRAAFERAVQAVLAAWDAGSFFPRVVDPAGRNEPARCSYCAVAEACLRGDSGARSRLFEWTARDSAAAAAPAEEALLAVWRLPVKEKRALPQEQTVEAET